MTEKEEYEKRDIALSFDCFSHLPLKTSTVIVAVVVVVAVVVIALSVVVVPFEF